MTPSSKNIIYVSIAFHLFTYNTQTLKFPLYEISYRRVKVPLYHSILPRFIVHKFLICYEHCTYNVLSPENLPCKPLIKSCDTVSKQIGNFTSSTSELRNNFIVGRSLKLVEQQQILEVFRLNFKLPVLICWKPTRGLL